VKGKRTGGNNLSSGINSDTKKRAGGATVPKKRKKEGGPKEQSVISMYQGKEKKKGCGERWWIGEERQGGGRIRVSLSPPYPSPFLVS